MAEHRDLLKRLLMLPTGNLCDAFLEMDRFPQVMRGLKSIGSVGAFAGPAFTLRQVPRPCDAPRTINLTQQAKVFDELAQRGQVVVIDTGGRDEVCTFGSILMVRARMRGLAGVVTDGAARDIEEIGTAGIPVHVRNANPIGSKVFFQTVAVNEPVSCGGVPVRPGDVVCGDATGVLVIPPPLLAEVVERAEAIQGREAKWMAGLNEGKSLLRAQQEA